MSVTQITDSNYTNEIKDGLSIVKFYADWCGSCRLFAPKFKRMSDDDSFSDLKFLEVDAENNPAFRATAEVTNLPFFGIYKNGEFIKGVSTAKEEALIEMINEVRN